MIRRAPRVLTVGVLVGALALSGCGAGHRHAGLRVVTGRGHFLTACASMDCGPFTATLHWQVPPFVGQTGYYVVLDGTRVGDVSGSSYKYVGMDCGTAFALGVAAHNASGRRGPLWTTSYTTPACRRVGVRVKTQAPASPSENSYLDVGVPVETQAPASPSGNPYLGQTLTAGPGQWRGAGIKFSYQWEQCAWIGDACHDVPGATRRTYTLSASDPLGTDAGHRLQALVTARNSHGSAAALPASATEAVFASAPTVYYVAAGGLDSNTGMSESSPWAHAPGMPTCTAKCASATISAGTEIIFKGGDSWGISNLPIAISATGSASAPIYYGVNPTWYDGASWTPPTLDEGTNPGTGSGPAYVNASRGAYVEIDGLHLTGFYNNNVSYTSGPFALIVTSTNESITNTTLDGWHHDRSCPSANGSKWCDAWFLAFIGHGDSILLQGDTVDDSVDGSSCAANLGGNVCSGGFVYNDDGTMVYDRNSCFEVVNCIEPYDTQNTITDSVFYDVGTSYDDRTGEGQHCNAIATSSNEVIAANVVHDVDLGCFAIEYEPTSSPVYLYDDVVWNTGGKGPFYWYSGTGTLDAWNNTVVGYTNGSDPVVCFYWQAGGGTANLDNNHCISTALANSTGTVKSTTNRVETWATDVTGNGYEIANEFSPTSASSPTVGAGTNLTTDCSGDVLSLCIGFDGHARRTGRTAWDQGAYEWLP